MATEFIMPKLGLTMEEGTITEWFVEDGDTVTAGAAVMRIETDKTETDVEAAGTGRLHRLGQVGETFACGEVIGWFLADGEAAPASAVPAAPAPSAAPQTASAPSEAGATGTSAANGAAGVVAGGRIMASPLAKRLATERNIDLRAITGTGPAGRIVSEDLDGVAAGSAPSTGSGMAAPVAAARAVSPIGSGGGAPATAAGRNLADLLGIDVAVVAPDPIEHRVTRESVALHVRQLLAAAAPTPAATTQAPPAVVPPAATQEPTSTVRLSGMRGTIARRMHDSLTQMAQLTLFMDADLDAVVADRERRKADGPPPSYTDYVIAAAARALGDHPLVNSQITADGVALLPTAHVGMAVALDNGLIVPVIHDAVGLDLDQLSAESTRLATAARVGSLDLADLEGGTFSVSTLGGFGVDGFTPVINPPNTAILGVGRLRDDLKLTAKGRAKATKRLTLSLTWDHRAFDGAPAAAFCRTIVELLDDPTALDSKKDA